MKFEFSPLTWHLEIRSKPTLSFEHTDTDSEISEFHTESTSLCGL